MALSIVWWVDKKCFWTVIRERRWYQLNPRYQSKIISSLVYDRWWSGFQILGLQLDVNEPCTAGCLPEVNSLFSASVLNNLLLYIFTFIYKACLYVKLDFITNVQSVRARFTLTWVAHCLLWECYHLQKLN